MITKEMIIRDVTEQYPETVNVFGNFGVDFCCGGSHSIEQTARACGVTTIDQLIEELNRVAAQATA
ncbi:MAG: DUF542 domain-containing protein [Candidatus Tectomicrobia bacterium]|nr:DUF542 domain-containing protein [Candidatus Tectomicrobia bacterium]